MFSQLIFMRLRAAEKALRDGRLDEAYRLATAPDLKENRRAAAVLADLTEKLVERAREHFRAERFSDAFLDLDKAEAGDVSKDKITELRAHVQVVANEVRRKDYERRERLQEAVRRVEAGSLEAGRRILEHASAADHAAGELRKVVDQRAGDLQVVIEQAERLLQEGQYATAGQRVRRARTMDAQHSAVVSLEARLCECVFEQVRRSIREGRLSRASTELNVLGDLGSALPARRELAVALTMARDAAKRLERHEYMDARRIVLGLGRLIPEAKWVTSAAEKLDHAEELRTELAAGPLGERLEQGIERVSLPIAAGPASLDDTVALGHRFIPPAGGANERLLVLVDGGGSFLLLSGGHASIGRAAAENPPDVPILSDLAERHATIARADEDYFLYSAKEVELGGQRTQHHLLRDGDRVVLGKKAKFTFRVPSRRSATAVLELSDTTKMPNDVRRVVLFSKHAMIGQGPTVHLPCRHAGSPLILFERAGELWIRPQNDGRADMEAKPLRLGQPVEVGGMRITVNPWPQRQGGSA